MLNQVLKLQVALIDTFGSGIVSWDGQPNHELLLQSQILEISVQDSSKVVDAGTFGWEVNDDLLNANVGAHTDLLLHDGL